MKIKQLWNETKCTQKDTKENNTGQKQQQQKKQLNIKQQIKPKQNSHKKTIKQSK